MAILKCAVFLGASALVAMTGATSALAQNAVTDDAQLHSELQAMREREKAALARVEALERRLELIEQSANIGGAAPITDEAKAMMRGRGYAAQQQPSVETSAQPPSVETSTQQEAEPDRKAPAPTDAVEVVSRAAQNQYGNRFSLDAGFTYSRFSNAQLNLSGFLALDAIFLGLISIDEVNADIFTTDLTARYGLTDRLQLDVNIPYIIRRSNFQSGGAGGNASGLAEVTVKAHGFGDISAGASYRVLQETAKLPDVVVNARVKAPTGRHPFGIEVLEVEGTEGNLTVPKKLSTGTGVWGAALGVSVLKTIDPMVVFGSLTYFHNFARKFDDLDEATGDQPGRARTGNAFQYGVGVAFALNDKSSISLSTTQRFASRTRIKREGGDWFKIVGSQANVGVLNVGATFSLSEQLALLANVGAGLTDDAPDMVVSLRLPYRF